MEKNKAKTIITSPGKLDIPPHPHHRDFLPRQTILQPSMSLACSSTCTCRLYSELCCSLHILLSFHSFSDYPSDFKILLPLSCRWIQFYPPKQTMIKAASLWSLELHQGIFLNMGEIYPWDKSCYFCRWHRHRSYLWTTTKKCSLSTT